MVWFIAWINPIGKSFAVYLNNTQIAKFQVTKISYLPQNITLSIYAPLGILNLKFKMLPTAPVDGRGITIAEVDLQQIVALRSKD